jgi:4-hydroxy-tetrahydrodipicolinate synthase
MKPVFCAAVTPMNKNEAIDYSGFETNLDWYIGQGLSGITVNGGTGEFVSLTMQERKKLAETAVRQIGSRADCMVCCAAETTGEVIDYAKHAKSIGADSIMIIGPYYFKPSDEEIRQHYWSIAEAVDIPIVLYNNPGSSGIDLRPALIAEICSAGNIRHVKEASGDLRRIREIRGIDSSIHVYCGSDDIITEALANGAVGWISITANLLPGQSQRLFDAYKSGNAKRAREIFDQYAPLYAITEKPYKAIQTAKYCMDRLGLAGGTSRRPRLPLTAEEKSHVDQLLADAGLL